MTEEVREIIRWGAKLDYFSNHALRAVKKVARNGCEAKMRLGKSKKQAALETAAEIHRRWPTFKLNWERINGVAWPGNGWFAKRIDHQSKEQDNKGSHLCIAQIAQDVALDNCIFEDWEQWERLVADRVEEVRQTRYLYHLPGSARQNSNIMEIQKVGITTNLSSRRTEHCSRGERGTNGWAFWPAPDYILTCCLGEVSHKEARDIESQCHAAMGRGKPAHFGKEWFKIPMLQALTDVLGVLRANQFDPEVHEWVLKRLISNETL